MSQFLENKRFFVERLRDSSQSKQNFVKTFDVRHYTKRYSVSRGITGWCKKQLLSIIYFLNDMNIYDGEQNQLSEHLLDSRLQIDLETVSLFKQQLWRYSDLKGK